MRKMNHDLLMKKSAAVFDFDPEATKLVPGHQGGRNVVYEVAELGFLRISTLEDRTLTDYLAETEYVHFLACHGATVADAVPSVNGALVEVLDDGCRQFAVSLFKRAEGDQLADHGYRYIDGRPLEELWYNTGKTLGKIHALSKQYQPQVRRFDFFDKYNEDYLEGLIPDDLTCVFLGNEPVGRAVKQKMHELLDRLRALPADPDHYGMVHFDFSDGNYNIDYTDGTIHVYDFDNCRTAWYLFDLANLWSHCLGWIAWRDDAAERRRFTERFMRTVYDGYRSETDISDDMIANLPVMLDAVHLENIIDEFEVQKAENGILSCDGEQAYRLKCLLEDIPYMGFFDAIYDTDSPFDLDKD